MEDRLKPCPFCGGEDVKILYFTSVLCRGICNVCGASGHVSEVPAEAIEQWNCRAPLYSPVKPEDITDGWYWHKPSADDDAEIVYIRCEDGTFGMDTQDRFITVLELYMWGGVLFRIPELPDLEVPE